jgi:hypothetical protein
MELRFVQKEDYQLLKKQSDVWSLVTEHIEHIVTSPQPSRTTRSFVCFLDCRSLPKHLSRDDALQRLTLLVELIDPSPERTSAFSVAEVTEFQKILTDHNYTVRQLMREVGLASTGP